MNALKVHWPRIIWKEILDKVKNEPMSEHALTESLHRKVFTEDHRFRDAFKTLLYFISLFFKLLRIYYILREKHTTE